MIEKDKDLFLDMLENPNLTLEDMISVGHSAEKTRFLDKSIYENSQRVRNKFMDAEGNFKQDEFDRWYAVAADAYQTITNKDANLSLLNVTAFNESDITVDPSKRTLNTAPIVSFSPNPDRLSTSIYRVGKTSERERTQSELALAEKVLLNPVEAAKDPSKARWGDSPNDSWWGNFFDTQVLALWDEDGEHIDLVTKLKVTHKKGDLKLNDNGTYYYEALDGRDIYGRQVLNKMNTITTDGSFWNQYDFFDSDDIKEKSFVGSVAKNLALVGSMFIPYVGWGIAGASIAVQTTGLLGTLGKMLTGSDSPTFSAMEGWAKSLNRQTAKSEYAQQHMLCWENFIDLIGDTTALLREQRAIFKFAPAIFGKGKYGIESKHFGANTTALKAEKSAALRTATNPNLSLGEMARAVGGENPTEALMRANATKENIISRLVDKEIKSYFEDYSKMGELLARAYMVGLTVGDTYGEAKEAGASDFEAALLTMGYAAAENKLLKSELGRWIFPELKAERATMSLIAKKAVEATELTQQGITSTLRSSGVTASKAELIGKRIAEMPQDVRKAGGLLNKLDDNGKLAWMKKWFNTGRDIFNQQKSVMRGTLGAAFSNALAEGTEEVSEELLKDFSTSCFNLVKAAQGDKETRMQGFLGEWDWNEALKRYGMSFFGGLIGGGINSAAYDYRQFKDISNMTSEQAMLQLVWMDRNNELDKFWDVVSKETLADKYHSTEQDENGTFKLANGNNSQDLEVKRALRQQLDLVHNILTANGANVDDDGLIGLVMHALPSSVNTDDILGDFRTDALSTSVTAGRFLKEYNNLCKAIVMESIKLKGLMDQVPDTGKVPGDLETAIKESQDSLNVLKQAKEDLLGGKRTLEFYRDALFETTYGVSESFIAPTEVQFMERETGRPYALIPKEEKEELKRKYIEWSKTERSEKVHLLADIFYGVALNTSQALQNSAEVYDKIKKGLLERLKKLTDVSEIKLREINGLLSYGPEEKLEEILNIILEMSTGEKGVDINPTGLDVAPDGSIISTDGSISDLQNALGNTEDSFVNKIREISGNSSLTDDLKVPLMMGAFLNNICSELNQASKEIIEAGYVHPEVRRNLVSNLEQLKEYCTTWIDRISSITDEITDLNLADEYSSIQEQLEEYETLFLEQIDQIDELHYTPITENLKNFGVSLGVNQNVLTLVEEAVNKEKNFANAIDNIILDEDQAKQFEEAQNLLKLYRASVVAARTDNADIEHIFGYNKTLNELCGGTENYTPLAEIDAETAQLAIQDINLAIDRLNMIKGVSDLNQGNKLNVLNYASANKSYILFNKTNKLLSTLLNEDNPEYAKIQEKWNKDGALDKLQLALSGLRTHAELAKEKVADRKLSLNSQEKEEIERELHVLDNAIYEFFQSNQDKLADNDEARADLAHFIKAAQWDLYDKNEGLLTHTSEDIDDGAFIWWLASKAALKGSDFYKAYRKVISEEVAPIPTQELGVYAAIAAIYNGNVFSAFGKAMKQFVKEDWESRSDVKIGPDGKWNTTQQSGKLDIILKKGLLEYLPATNTDLNELDFSSLIPQFNNILFIEGAPGSGKSTGVFKTIVSVLNSLNPDIDKDTKLLSKPIWIAHSTEENSGKLAESLNFQDGSKIQAVDKQGLLKLASAEYKDRLNPDTETYEYYMDEDCILGLDGNIHSKWKVRQLDKAEVPSVIFIDEWSRYTYPEADLIQRFAQEYGIQVIAAGDLDLLKPEAKLFKSRSEEDMKNPLIASIDRNITPRVPKLGISMRSGNGLKVLNLATIQAWKRNRTTEPVELLYVETPTDIYGDKIHRVEKELTDLDVERIKKDVDKLVANLQEGEKIGYIFHDKNSKLYQLLTSDLYKDKIDAKSETAAQGTEARYYIVENNRDPKLNEDAYLASYYTGISRAELASISIVPKTPIGKLTVKNPTNQENKLIPDHFTPDGIKRFSIQRKNLLNKIYGLETSDLSKIIPRPKDPVPLDRKDLPKPPKSDNDKDNNDDNSFHSEFNVGDTLANGTDRLQILGIENRDTGVWYKVTDNNNTYTVAESSLLQQGWQVNNTPPPMLQQLTLQLLQQTLNLQQLLTPQEELLSDNKPTLQLTLTPENIKLVADAITKIGIPVYDQKQFNINDLARALGVLSTDLSLVLSHLQSNGIISDLAGGLGNYLFSELRFMDYLNSNVETDTLEDTTTLPETEVEPEENTPGTSIIPSFKVGDKVKFKADGNTFTIINIELKSPVEIVYTLECGNKKITVVEPILSNLLSKGLVNPVEDTKTPDGTDRQPEMPETSFDRTDLEKVLEEITDTSDKLPEEVRINGDDIDPQIFGYSWNTNYIGVEFDPLTGKPKLPQGDEPGSQRIDAANGLIKLNPIKFTNEKVCRQVIGTIRKAMWSYPNRGYKDEKGKRVIGIDDVIKANIPSLKNKEIIIGWYFISKSKDHKKGDGGRFYFDQNLRLENMIDREHAEIPIKTISMLVGVKNADGSTTCVLEMPAVTLSSPFTILYKLGKLDPNNKVFLAYYAASQNINLTHQQVLESVIQAILNLAETKNNKGELKLGYKKLADLCKLWQFTSDGIRYIPKIGEIPFSLHESTKNLGSHYIKDRITELTVTGKQSRYDYRMEWHDLASEAFRTDVNYSNIMIAQNDTSKYGDRIVAAGHPFVLRSNSDEFRDTESMMKRYIEQCHDPNLEKTVKLILLSPPQIGVGEYLRRRITEKSGCNYGNEFSAYRILSRVRALDDKLYKNISHATIRIIDPIIKALDEVKLEPKEGDNHQQMLSRVYESQKQIMEANNGVKLLSDALFELTSNYNGNKDNEEVADNAIIDLIEKLCNASGITGILYRPVCIKAENAQQVAGFGTLLQVDAHNRFLSPDGKSFRIYSKYDTPMFDMNVLTASVASWALQARQGFTTPGGLSFPNVWWFDNGKRKDFARDFYEGKTKPGKRKEKSPNQLLREKYANLLEKLGLKDYDKLNGISDEKHFLEIIRDKYIETPGNIALVLNGEKLIYAKLDNVGVEGINKFPEEFKNATQEKFESNNAGDNSYTLTLKLGDQELKLNVELIADNSEMIFDLGKPESKLLEAPVDVFDFEKCFANAKKALAGIKMIGLREKLTNAIQSIKERIQNGESRASIVEDFSKKTMVNDGLRRVLGEEFFNVNGTNQEQDQNINEAVCSITVRKKFM